MSTEKKADPHLHKSHQKSPSTSYSEDQQTDLPPHVPPTLPEGWVHIPGIYTGPDRRKNPTPMFSRFLFWGKRRKNSNVLDKSDVFYTDRMTKQAWKFFLITVLLSAVDGGFSIYYIVFGKFQELNPVLRPLIEQNGFLFLAGKTVLTLGGLVFLVVHQHFQLFKWVTVFVIGLYSSLCVYHLYLLSV